MHEPKDVRIKCRPTYVYNVDDEIPLLMVFREPSTPSIPSGMHALMADKEALENERKQRHERLSVAKQKKQEKQKQGLSQAA